MGSWAERPLLRQSHSPPVQASPALSSRWSGMPLRRSEMPLCTVLTGASGDRPLLASSPPLLLTYTTRVSTLGSTCVQPSGVRETANRRRDSSASGHINQAFPEIPDSLSEAVAIGIASPPTFPVFVNFQSSHTK